MVRTKLTLPRFTSDLKPDAARRLQAAADTFIPMRRGERSEAVKALQQALIDVSKGEKNPKFDIPDGATGFFGDQTFRAVFNFQGVKTLAKDGEVGGETLGKLQELLSKPAGGGGGGGKGNNGGGGSTLTVIPFEERSADILAARDDDRNKEDLDSSDPPRVPLRPAEAAIVAAFDAQNPGTRSLEFAMRAELFVGAGSLGLSQLNNFIGNAESKKLITFDKDSEFAKLILASDEFKEAHAGVKRDLDDALKRQFVSRTIDFRKLRAKKRKDKDGRDILGNEDGVKEPPDISFEGGPLKVLIGNTQGALVALKSFEVDKDKATYRAGLTYEFTDHFGVDNSDLVPDGKGHGSPGQQAFWMLQHKFHPGHVPFIYKVQVEPEPVTGNLDPARGF
jgi:peptidoglycan hydrolase-like protein with peptidoglycan-binding domain